jgi:hypothetical protein
MHSNSVVDASIRMSRGPYGGVHNDEVKRSQKTTKTKTSSKTSLSSSLQQLAKLNENGMLSDAEFAAAKAKIINS